MIGTQLLLRVIIFFFAIATILGENSKHKIIAKVSEVIRKRYFTGCTEFLFSNGDDKIAFDVFEMGKIMMSSVNRTGCIALISSDTYLKLLDTKEILHHCSRVLSVLYGEEKIMKKFFTELSFKAKMKDSVWLIFLDRKSSPEEFFENANIPFDVDLLTAQIVDGNIVELKEAYRVSLNHKIRVKKFGSWKNEYSEENESGLELPSHISLYYRREDLEGLNFKVATKDNFPMSYPIWNGKQIISIGGYLGEIWNELARCLNFTSTYYIAEENGIKRNRKWHGITGMIYDNVADVGLSDITITEERSEVLDFLRPLITTRNQIYFKTPGTLIRWDSIRRPFHTHIWLIIPIWIITASISLTIFFHLARKHELETDTNVIFTMGNSLLTSFRALCQQGSNMEPSSISCRAIFFSSYLVATVLLTAYSCALTSYITVQSPKRPFKNLRELLMDGTYRIEPIVNSADYAYFADARNLFFKIIFEKLIAITPKDKLPKTRKEALEHVCFMYKIAHFGPKFMTDPIMDKLNKDLGCNIIPLESALDVSSFSIAMKKESQYTNALNHHLGRMGYNGQLYRLRKSIWPPIRKQNTIFKDVEATQVIQIHIVLLIGIIVSSVIFLSEIICNRWKFDKHVEKFYLLLKSLKTLIIDMYNTLLSGCKGK